MVENNLTFTEMIKEAERGDPVAQCNVGVMLYEGQGVSRDFSEAAKWYICSAEQGYHEAQNSLAAMYSEGVGLEKDLAQAHRWFRLSAEQGNPKAQCNLGGLIAGDYKNEEFNREAFGWVLKAVQNDFVPAFSVLGVMHVIGLGTEQDFVQAYVCFARRLQHDPDDITEMNLAALIEGMSEAQVEEAKQQLVTK